VLFNGRLYAELKSAELKSVARATKLGNSDAQAPLQPHGAKAFPWAPSFSRSGAGGPHVARAKGLHLFVGRWHNRAGFRAGIYCSGIPSPDDENVVTAEDIRAHAARAPAPHVRSFTGRSTMLARLRRAVCFRRARQVPPKAALASPRSGSSRNRLSAKTSPGAAPTTAGWRMLSARNFAGTATSCGLELRNQPRPFTGRTH